MMARLPLCAFLILTLLGPACGKFNVSPYVSNTPNTRLNHKHLALLQKREASAPATYKVAVLADLHDYYKELEEQVEYINNRKAEFEFVIIAGDLTNLGLLREFETAKSFLDKLAVPYVTIPGNHDLLSNGESIYDQMFGPSNYSFSFKQTKFILFNNNNWESTGKVPDLDFVENELAASASSNIVLVAHVSPSDKDRWNQSELEDMKALVNAHDVDYFINGHDHNPASGAFGNSVQVTTGAPVKGKILELNISNGGVAHQHVGF